jgi:hypothetical protein
MLALAVGPTLALALWWSPVTGMGDLGWRLIILRTAAVTSVWAACALVAWRHGGWRAALSP